MEISVTREAFVFICSVLCGGLIFLLYDLFRLIRRKTKGDMIVVHVQDGLFWILALCLLFFCVFHVNNGVLRLYEIIGAGLGALLYGLTLSPLVLRLLDQILKTFAKIFKFFCKILLTPLLFAYNIMYRCLCFIFLPLKTLAKRGFRRFVKSLRRSVRFIKKK